MTSPYQPRHQWHRTRLDGRDLPTDFDWCGQDGGEYIGRVRKEAGGPTKDKWHWAGAFPRTFKGTPPTPNKGDVATARVAIQMVEEYWDRCLRQLKNR